MLNSFIVRLGTPPARPLTAGMHTTNTNGPLHVDSHYADHTENNNKNFPFLIVVAEVLQAGTGPKNAREGGFCGCGHDLRMHTAQADAIGGRCARLVASAGQAEGQREGRRGRQNVRMRQK